jgi:hypothetical protein
MSRTLTVTWNEIGRARWDAAHAAAAASYQQDWAYGEVMRGAGAKVLRAAVKRADGSLAALAQIVARPFALVATFALCTHGPVWVGDVSASDRREAYHAIRRALPLSWPRLLVVTPDDAMDESAGLQGQSRVMTGDATVLVDLSRDDAAMRAGLESKWRNALVKAEKSALKVQRVGLKPGQYQWLIDAEAKQRQKRGYRALPLALTEAWQASKAEAAGGDRGAGLAVWRADIGRDAVAGMLFLVHGRRATYHIGWTNEAGRDNAAHNLILWTAMLEVKARGVDVLDLGGVNTQSGAGIARFKFGTGGAVLQRAGAYV